MIREKPVRAQPGSAAGASRGKPFAVSSAISFFFLLISFMAPEGLQAGAGRTAMNFLRINASPRSLAMGETGAGLADDSMSAMYLNPAGLARLRYPEASFSYNLLYEDISLQHLSYAHPTRRWGAFGFSGTVLQVEKFDGYDNSGLRVGDVAALDFAIKPVYARRLAGPSEDQGQGLFVGAAAKYARSELDTVSAGAVMADAGALFVRSLGRGTFGIGGSAMSVGRGPDFGGERDKPATVYGLGLSYGAYFFGDPFTLAADVKMPVYDEFSYAAGLEYGVKRILFVRGGFISHQSLGAGWRVGLGIKAKFLQVDYALSEHGKMGMGHLMGVSVRFGEPIETTPHLTPGQEKAAGLIRRARALIQDSRHYEAALSLDEALTLDPNNKEALRLLRQVRDALERSR
ncbi:MAG: PorV/PorQ family protein [Elusimicrobia bacterium]|nr:PorV/PorQ family protein [Elusimicrobiota bacterium]